MPTAYFPVRTHNLEVNFSIEDLRFAKIQGESYRYLLGNSLFERIYKPEILVFNFRKIYARFLLDGVKELYYTKSYEQKEYKKGYYPERI